MKWYSYFIHIWKAYKAFIVTERLHFPDIKVLSERQLRCMGFKCSMDGVVIIYSVNCHKMFNKWLFCDMIELSYIYIYIYMCVCVCMCVWGGRAVVFIATGYGLEGPGIESRCGPRFSAPVQTGLGAHPASCTMANWSFPGVKSGRDVTLNPRPLLMPWSRKGRAVPLLPL